MKKILVGLSAVVLMLGVGTLRSFADAPDAQVYDLSVNLSGTYYDLGTDGAGGPGSGNFLSDIAGIGVSLGSYDLGTATNTGLGSFSLTIDNTTSSATGSMFFDALIAEAVGTDFYDEYASTSGSASGGLSYQIDNYLLPTSTILADAQGSTAGLPDSNDAIGGIPDSPQPCTTSDNCNGQVLVALGYQFSIAANSTETVTVTASTTAPSSGFYIDQTNPADAGNLDANGNPLPSDVYYSLSATDVPDQGVCTSNCNLPPPPPVVPEPSSWILVASGLGAGLTRLRRRFPLRTIGKFAGMLVVAVLVLVSVPTANAQQALTVPWVAGTSSPHTAYSGANIVLGAVFIPKSGSTDSYTYAWNFGDGTSYGPVAVTNTNDLSTTHTYTLTTVPGGSAPVVGVTTWSAQVTVTDTTTLAAYSANYPVIWEDVNALQSRVNVAIDWGLWYLHVSMYHPSATTGNWSDGCASGYYSYSCGQGWTSLTATNVQAMEVNGHQSVGNGGSATDPYATDVAEGLDYLFQWLNVSTVPATTPKLYYVDPSSATFGCSDGNAPSTTLTGTKPVPGGPPLQGYCSTGAVEVFYNAGATSCPLSTTVTSCSYTFNSNPSGNAYYVTRNVGDDAGYEQGMVMDAIVASTNPNAVVPATNLAGAANPVGVAGQTYGNIVKGFADYINYCQYSEDYDIGTGYIYQTRGAGDSDQGGGWLYSCNSGDDNSTSQWESIGLISANRGFGDTIPQVVRDENEVWTTNAETAGIPGSGGAGAPTQANPYNSGGEVYNASLSENQYEWEGGFGYRGNLYYSNEWGPFAVTPSGMVQMSLDGVGRTTNTLFPGNSTTSSDQRFNTVETFYADNFCNNTTLGAYDAPRAYTYGLFSFTKSMLLHNPGGVLSPIQYMRTMTPGVFTTNSTVPANTIDWYAAVGSGHPFSSSTNPDPCDGIAQTLVSRQYLPANGLSPATTEGGYWWNEDVSGDQYYFETAWSLIMLNRTVFVNCVNNLTGLGVGGTSLTPARIDLSWSAIPNVTGYNVLVSTTSGGPYTQVTYNGGTTKVTAFSDRSGLTNGQTYYFVLQPINGSTTVCQSNQATIKVPKPL